MTNYTRTLWLAALLVLAVVGGRELSHAQPARGAPAAFEEVRRKLVDTAQQLKVTGDPNRDFANMLVANMEDSIYIAKTQLEYGGDEQLRQVAQNILDNRQKQLDELKQWLVRTQGVRGGKAGNENGAAVPQKQ